jgi:ATP:ADP antiporter, AAA family
MKHARRPGAAWLSPLRSLSPDDLPRLLALMGMFFLVVCAVGILRPIKNSLALDGLGSTGFYKVYLVSAVVVLFVPAFTALSGRMPWRTLFSVIALFFATNLVLFRLLYAEGSAAFGLVFYGWYDLFAAALVTQFFMATQFYFNARSAKSAYPLVIAGGSIGATLGGAITGFFAESVGTPNLLLVAATLIAIFAVAIPWVLKGPGSEGRASSHGAASTTAADRRSADRTARRDRGSLRELLADRHVLLIAATVLLTVVVKQLVDYQYNAITKDVFVTLDAVSSFQGKFNAATQWLPLLVLAGLRPAMRRWGMGVAVLLLPAFMLASTAALAVAFGLIAAVLAKGSETSLRYSAERAGREILYVPLREDIKLKAKAYIDVAVEKGLGKVLSALVIMVLLQFIGYRQIAWVSAALSLCWLFLALAVRREYVTTLARSIEGRFASLQGTFASLIDASTLPVLRRTLTAEAPLRAAFGLELLGQMPAAELRPLAPELNRLLRHDNGEIRAAALGLLNRIPDQLDAGAAERLLTDEVPAVRNAAVRALLDHGDSEAPAVLNRLLNHDAAAVRTAALTAVLGTNGTNELRRAGRAWIQQRWQTASRDEVEAREELALAAGTLRGDEDADLILAPFLDDDDTRVRGTALRSAGLLHRVDLAGRMIAALGHTATRDAARDALISLGTDAIEPLAAALLDEQTAACIRREVPRTLARIPSQKTVDALLHLVIADETDQLLDLRALKALSKLRARNPDLKFDVDLVMQVAERDCDAAELYRAARLALPASGSGAEELLRRALDEGFAERRECVFRCLGMVYPADSVHRVYNAVATGSPARRANALEWLEQTIGTLRFRRLRAVLEPVRSAPASAESIESLSHDGDAWIALLARASTSPMETEMELIEKVLLLQQIDLLRGSRGTHAALLGTIAEEIEVDAGTVLIRAGEPPAAMYIVTRGQVELSGVGQRLVIEPEGAFGTWALIDDQPSPVEALAVRPTALLRITREDFHDLLADHSELAVGLLQGLARRMRSLVA